MRKIVICGGHLTPALALIEKLEKRKDAQIIFFGRKYATEGNKSISAEYRQITKKGIKFIPITAGRLQRKFTTHTIPSLLKIPVGSLQAFFNLLLIRPQIVISFGGYLSLPVVFCAWLLGIDCLTHEQATVPGLANRINSLFVKKIFLSWPQSEKYFDSQKVQTIGNLTRESIFKTQAKDPKLSSFLKNSKNLIFVTGGNQGSHFLNKLTREIAPVLRGFSFVHQVGTANFDNDIEKSQKIKLKNYFPLDYIDSENIGAVFKKSDLVISRSGANTVWDLGILKKASILIPLPIAAGGEQGKNARILISAGSANVLRQEETNAKTLINVIREMFKNLKKYQNGAAVFSKSLPKDAASQIVNCIYSN